MKISTIIPFFGAALAALAYASDAQASVSFCVQHDAQYIDSGGEMSPACTAGTSSCEDTWVTDSPRRMRGALVRIQKGTWSTFRYAEDRGSAAGCTPFVSPTGGDAGSYNLRVYTQGLVDGEFVRVTDGNSWVGNATLSVQRSGSGRTTHTLSPTGATGSEFNVYAAAAEATVRLPGDRGFEIQVDSAGCNGTGGGCFRSAPNKIFLDIAANNDVEKFAITHEMGHAVMSAALGGGSNGSDCSYNSPACPSAGSHSMTSQEFSNCGLVEGFGHFYAAAAWNNQTGSDCWFNYWSPVPTPVNCEFSSAGFPLQYMENQCDPVIAGYGNELDWMRALWDFYQNGHPAPRPDFADVLDFVAASGGWSQFDAWPKTQEGAHAVGRIHRWRSAAWSNGVDH